MFHTNNPKKQFVKFETEKYEDNHCREIIITCDNFSAKILPAGLEIFSENRRLELAFPSNPGVNFAPRTKMKTSKEKSVKRRNLKGKGTLPET